METYGLEKLGIIEPLEVYRNLSPAELVEAALFREEGTLADNGALIVTTGKYTGTLERSNTILILLLSLQCHRARDEFQAW